MGRVRAGGPRWNYEQGLFLMAARLAGDALGDPGLAGAARELAAGAVEESGLIRGYRREDYNLDQVAPGKNLFDLLERSGEARFAEAIESLSAQLRSQPRTPSGGFWHKAIYPNQMWLDGLFMAQPFVARYAIYRGSDALVEDILLQFSLAGERTLDPGTGLNRHAWDESRTQLWADPETGRSPHAWGRALGWYAMALADVLELLPPRERGTGSLAAQLERVARAALRYRDRDSGLWPQVLDQGGREGNYIEASASAMLAYAMAKGVRLGHLPAEPFAEAASSAHRALSSRFLSRDAEGLHLEGTCAVAGLGGSPYRDGSFDYYVREPVARDDLKGVGPFVLASTELELAEGRARGEAAR